MHKSISIFLLAVLLFVTGCSEQAINVESMPPTSEPEIAKQVSSPSPSPSPSPTTSPTVKPVEEGHEYELIFPSDKYPETALHIHGAIEQGHSAVCTIDREGADENRKKSLAGIDTMSGYDRDEWPMAMCEEGGEGASVAYIDASDNRGAGSWVGNQLSDYPNGTKVLFIVEKPKNLFPNQPITTEPESNTTDKPAVSATSTPEPTAKTDSEPVSKENISYANCTAVREAGAAPIYKGDPGYSKKLDRDGDGVGCE